MLCTFQHFVPEPKGCVRCTTSVAAAPPFCPTLGWGCVSRHKILYSLISQGNPRAGAAEKMEECHVLATYGYIMKKT